MNAEGYPDPTADKAIKRADKAPEQVSELIRTIKIHLKDQKTGRKYT